MLPQDLPLCGPCHFHRSCSFTGPSCLCGPLLTWTMMLPQGLYSCLAMVLLQVPSLSFSLQFPSVISPQPSLHPITTSLSSIMKKVCHVYHHALSSQRVSRWTLNIHTIRINLVQYKMTKCHQEISSSPRQCHRDALPGLRWGSASDSGSYSFQSLLSFLGID